VTGPSAKIPAGNWARRHREVLPRPGWNVIATMRSPERETELSALERVLVTRLDVQDSGSITAAVTAGIERFGRIGVLLNNAGYGAYGVLEAIPAEKIRRQFDVNVLGLLETTKAVLPHLRANGGGTIANISSIGGKVTFPLGTPYHGTKFAVEGLSEALHYELAAIGVAVKIVEPGFVDTDFAGRSFDFTNDENLAEYHERAARGHGARCGWASAVIARLGVVVRVNGRAGCTRGRVADLHFVRRCGSAVGGVGSLASGERRLRDRTGLCRLEGR
jgi:NAD(P)-dependent dehydrogenase (short-subunit alcohol dehydrogenase family)